MVTDRLLEVDPEWSWEPLAFDADGTPLVRYRDGDAVLWIRLTIAGMTRLGVGIVQATAFELEKQLISDALRNGAMRFGVALDLWSKEIILPPADPVATKHATDAFTVRLTQLGLIDNDKRLEFLQWKNDQGFEWPWTVAALKAMEAELFKIVGDGEHPPSEATATADPPSVPDAFRAGDSGEPETSGAGDAAASPASPDTGTLLDDARPF